MKKLVFNNNVQFLVEVIDGYCSFCDEKKSVAKSVRATGVCSDCAQQIALEISNREANESKANCTKCGDDLLGDTDSICGPCSGNEK